MLILASGSPRRRDLLLREGLSFCVLTRPVQELNIPCLPPAELCTRNAVAKAAAVAALCPTHTVIGADTLVFLDGLPLGKPTDLADARRMLTLLQGRTHCVCTAVAISGPGNYHTSFAEMSYVTFRPLSPQNINSYIAGVHVLDKAGAYAMQEGGELIIASVRGDTDNVIGLPVRRLLRTLLGRSETQS